MHGAYNLLKEQLLAVVALDPVLLEEIAGSFSLHHFTKNQLLLAAGQVEQRVYFVAEGVIRAYFDTETEEKTATFTYTGYWCSSFASFLSQAPSVYTIQALTDCTLLGIDKPTLEALFDKSHLFERFFRKATEQLVIGMEFRERELMASTAEERFQRFISQSGHLVKIVPQKYIAGYLNMTPETFSRLRKKQLP